MSYEYVKRTYSVNPKIGEKVRHTVTNKTGVIAREDRSQSHYVKVRFEDRIHSVPCHPTELEYLGVLP